MRLDAELAIVVGTIVRRADRDTAREAIAGHTVANDFSVRGWQRKPHNGCKASYRRHYSTWSRARNA
ncbi:fumarylacetoacetate hydrolase family protein [Nocardia pseudovaccinii]|uniref:fumarylacetoacetate hydrolase family protein n=1 Tax=Nocardia pseudovaccinii TaxID=189540 RepID=UPI003D89BB7C